MEDAVLILVLHHSIVNRMAVKNGAFDPVVLAKEGTVDRFTCESWCREVQSSTVQC